MAFEAGRRQRGFILAVTLWVLAGMAIAVGAMTWWAVTQVRDAQVARDQADDEQALHETRDTLLYLIATRGRTRAGQPTRALGKDELAIRKLDDFGGISSDPVGSELQIDGSHYRGLGSTQFALQDEAGLFSVVYPAPASVDAFLALHGVDAALRPRLRDALLDYIDADDLSRINGAEARDYAREHRPPPPNRRLLTPGELARVLGWDKLPRAQLAAMIEDATPYYAGGINPNTMPASLLPLRIPGCPETCGRLMKERRRQPFASAADLRGRLAIQLPGDDALDYRFVADDAMRITLWRRTGVAWRMHVRLTPLADKQGPWSILAAYPVARPAANEPVEDTESPLFAQAPAGK